MKKSKQLIISKQRYIGNLKNTYLEYVHQTTDGYEWTKDIAKATRFYSSTKAVDFLNNTAIDGATIEPEPKPKLYKAQLIDVGRAHVNKDFFYNTQKELEKEIGSHLAYKGWDLHEIDPPGTWRLDAGFRTAGTIIITDVKLIENEK